MSKFMIMSRRPDLAQSRNIRIAGESFGSVAEFRCLGTTLTGRSGVRDGIRSGLDSGNAFCHSVRDHLSSRLVWRK
jgi:hypothetical protein